MLDVAAENGDERRWMALVIGNSRWHWGDFAGDRAVQFWDTPPYAPTEIQRLIDQRFDFAPLTDARWPVPSDVPLPPLVLASVVPAQTAYWADYPQCQVCTLEQVPLRQKYDTLGIDRALALWGAIQQFGCPVLVVDAGTALTFTGAAGDRALVGGAILPGLRLQLRALSQGTAALPATHELPTDPPPRWGQNTLHAIHSGLFYSLTATVQSFIADWQTQFPDSPVVLTGGDGAWLHTALGSHAPPLHLAPYLIFQGLQALWKGSEK